MLGDLSHNQTSQGAYRKPWDNQQCICLSGKHNSQEKKSILDMSMEAEKELFIFMWTMNDHIKMLVTEMEI